MQYIHPRWSTANDYRLRIRPVFPCLPFAQAGGEAFPQVGHGGRGCPSPGARRGTTSSPARSLAWPARRGRSPGCGPACAWEACRAVRMAGLDNGGRDEAVRWFEEISTLLGGEGASARAKLFRPPCRHPGTGDDVRGGLPCPGPGQERKRHAYLPGLSALVGRDAGRTAHPESLRPRFGAASIPRPKAGRSGSTDVKLREDYR